MNKILHDVLLPTSPLNCTYANAVMILNWKILYTVSLNKIYQQRKVCL